MTASVEPAIIKLLLSWGSNGIKYVNGPHCVVSRAGAVYVAPRLDCPATVLADSRQRRAA